MVLNREFVKAVVTEQSILEGLARNDRKAIESIYREHYNMVQALVVNNSGSAEDAKDIFQEALLVLYEKVTAGGFELHCQLKTYLYSVSRRLWLKRLLQQNRFISSDSDAETVPVEDELDTHEQRAREFELMEKAMGGLGEPCRSLLEAFYLQKKGMQEIAAQFGYTNADNAKNQKYKCLLRLKKLFFAQYKTDL
ncbi:sigma-70 family RNA polymerase sigma factor [Flaviaesturariibacter amylovorans]|uniref:RNA polymerase sigma-70 region 2 domain-containing protein n=1 Tax=Flaviaesturariibacter amylovorans TaxID=1084520 RepID=A0ABP8H3F2_9BACT